MPEFSHLHVHTYYSMLDGATNIGALFKKVKDNGMSAIAITDHGNMFGVPKFTAEAKKHDVKAIIGCEFYLAPNDCTDKSDKIRYHQILLAKNKIGYKNLAKLSSIGFKEGFYYKPRIDKTILKKYKEGLIATTCCLQGQVPRTIIDKGEDAAEKVFNEWLDIFGDDYYIELQRHGIKDQDTVNEVLVRWSKKYGVKMIATNDVHYLDLKDSVAQDILLCLQTGKDYDDPKRMKFDGDQFYLKTREEMEELFSDLPEALENTSEIVSKIDTPDLKRDVLMPSYKLPEGFTSEEDYLKHLTYEGAKRKYGEITQDIIDRLELELGIIKDMGFAGYFLIVQDFIAAAKQLNVMVGPGRGSAAGSAVAYSIDITNIDPIKYNLLFERFLNPERVSMPDIDIDFDDEGRQKVIDYVVDKYGKDNVAQIITYGTMAGRSAIRDVARVLKLPLSEADRLAKLVPAGPGGMNLEKAYKEVKELAEAYGSPDELVKRTLNFAQVLENTPRHTGIHAAGVIIAPGDLTEYIPVCTSKDAELVVTQYEGKEVEDFGMLKMDFLGLKTLSIIKDAVVDVKKNHGVEIDIDKIPLDDEKTYELYQRGDTIGTFQFESEGMRGYLKELKPTSLEDLIAMNALYRPGPMDYIPEFIDRKHGRKEVEYPHEWLEDILKNTYGIMVYQEQIMQTAQIMAGYSLGAADVLRRAMGKKKAEVMEQQKVIFVAGAKEKGVDEQKAIEVFNIMEKFAAYGFNRSHSAAYSVVAYQTAYLKANYPGEYMAAVLTHNMNDIKKVTFFMDECRRMGVPVLCPDVNESTYKFVVNKKGEIRFGIGAVKGVGEKAIEVIVEERTENGAFQNIFDLTKRVNLRSANKKSLESLALAGAFDCFEDTYRSQYFLEYPNEQLNVLEKAIKFGGAFQANEIAPQQSLFGESGIEEIPVPKIPEGEPWPMIEMLRKEKEVIGVYITGHPLDEYKLEVENFCNCQLINYSDHKGKSVTVAGIVTDVVNRYDKKGRPFGLFTIEDYTDSVQLALFSEYYLKFKHLLNIGECLYLKGKVQLRYNTTDRFEIRINDMELLAGIKNKLTKSITLNLALSDITGNFISELEKLVQKYPGQCNLNFKIHDGEDKIFVNMPSKKMKVDVNN
ncbi:DNA polymerase III subunit alpha, partial [Cytophagaceae bacterium AH-315-L13]|nr:DNA polymerase III subunit alpha [Cytophagaceae bacterium AH-315-L13]